MLLLPREITTLNVHIHPALPVYSLPMVPKSKIYIVESACKRLGGGRQFAWVEFGV